MTAGIDAASLARFRAVITARLGLQFDESKSSTLVEVLHRRVERLRLPLGRYLSRLETQPSADEIAALAAELTVPESYFFRHFDQYRALIEAVLPQCLAARLADRRLRLLSLGCASGEEPYTLAMLVRDRVDPAWDVSIVGADINPLALERARRARYSAWALRETAAQDRQRWFDADGRHFVVKDAARALVRFEQRNLVDDDPQFWQRDAFDVVFCRNVIMYFSPDQAQAVVARIARLLRADGFLFLGHAETLRGVSNDFHLRHTHGTFYYQRKDHVAERAGQPHAAAPHVKALPAPGPPEDAAWVDIIQRASARVMALTAARVEQTADTRRPAVPASAWAWDRGAVLELLQAERFADALAVMNTLPPQSGADPDVRLLRAVLLTHGGPLQEAEDACRDVLEVDELNAGAHYLLALCREGARDRATAIYHDQVAAYLDPGFAMPRLHLGLLARRAGDRATAQKELGDALVLLQREDAARVLLFGGGFSREALIALCRTELDRRGGHS